jgi:succinate-acetate transporter protein
LTPAYNAEASFLTGGANETAGISQFYSSFAFALCFFGLLVFIFFVCSLRTNVAFVLIFLLLTIAVFLLAATYWELAQGNAELGVKLEKVSAIYKRTKAVLTPPSRLREGLLLHCAW